MRNKDEVVHDIQKSLVGQIMRYVIGMSRLHLAPNKKRRSQNKEYSEQMVFP